MKKLVLVAALCMTAFAAFAQTSAAATLTSSNSRSVSGTLDGTGATFTGAGGIVRLVCTRHDVTITAAQIYTSAIATLSNPNSRNTGISVPAAENRYGGTCTYNAAGIFRGNIRVDNNCAWTITISNTRQASIALDGAGACLRVTFLDGGLPDCEISIAGGQSISVGVSSGVTARDGRTSISIIASNAEVTYTTNGRCAGDAGGIARQTESITFSTVGISVP